MQSETLHGDRLRINDLRFVRPNNGKLGLIPSQNDKVGLYYIDRIKTLCRITNELNQYGIFFWHVDCNSQGRTANLPYEPKMKKILIAAALLATNLVSPIAFASTIDLTFEGVGNLASVNNFYNGGTDSAGHSGVDYGVGFSSSSLGLIESTMGGSGNFSNPSSGDTVLFFTSSAAVMNDAAGFSNGFSFFYAASNTATVTVYSGLNESGSILATLTLPGNYSSCGYCRFDAAGTSFAGVARSIDFGGAANNVAFDDITIGSAIAGSTVPEPESMLLMGLGVAAMGLSRKLRRR